jgi:FkbM family methyltransferase
LKSVKKLVKNLFLYLGYEIRRKRTTGLAENLTNLIKDFGIDTVIDVGANEGQFALEIRSAGYTGEIVSFEPLTKAHAILVKNARDDQKWFIHSRVAIGECDGELEINIAGNSVSSSILPMLTTHEEAAVNSAYIGSERTLITTLDSAIMAYQTEGKRIFLKIDTQGFEWQVLSGAEDTIRYATGLQVELSLVPLYEGQKSWEAIISKIEKSGFKLWDIKRGFTDPRNSRTLQVDAIFFRE